MLSRFRGKKSEEQLRVSENDNAGDSSRSEEQVEISGVWAIAKSYDELVQSTKEDKFKFIWCSSDVTKDQARNLFNTLESNTALLGLGLKNQSFGDSLCPLASTLLQKNTTLQTLLLENCNIPYERVRVLANTLANNTTRLKELVLSGNAIGDKGVIELVDALKTNTQLRTLNLNNTGCGDKAMIALGKAMSHISILDELKLKNNKITDSGAKALLLGILNNWSLTWLYLDNNDSISEQLRVQIENRRNENYKWQKCKCSKTEIGSFLMERGMHLEAFLLYSEGFTTLDQVKDISHQMVPYGFRKRQDKLTEIEKLIEGKRSRNSPTLPTKKSSHSTPRTESNGRLTACFPNIRSFVRRDKVQFYGSSAVAKSYDVLLQRVRNDTCKEISYKVLLTMEEARKLFDVLATNKSLLSLCLRNQSLGDYICRLASNLLQKNVDLAHLLLSRNSISYDGAYLVANTLDNNRTRLKLLSFEGSAIGDKGAVTLVKVLKTNNQLRCLNLTNTDCGDDAATELGKAMSDIRTLDDLRLCKNGISNTGAKILLSGLIENRSIVKLALEGNKKISKEVLVDIEKRCKQNKQEHMSKCSNTELGSFLISEGMTDEAYGLYKEGYRMLDEVAETSSYTLCYEKAPFGLTDVGLIKVKDKVGKPSYCKSQMGAFLSDNGYEKHCRNFFRFDRKEIRPLYEADLKNMGVTDKKERVELVQLLKEASGAQELEPTQNGKPTSDESVKEIDNVSSSYSAFVCHHIIDTGVVTTVLRLKFQANYPEMKDLYLPHRARTLDDFLPQVRATPVFLVLLSKGFFSSQWCIAELIEAFLHPRPIIAVRVIDREETTVKRDEFGAMCSSCSVLSDEDSRKFLRMRGLLENAEYALRALSKTLLIDFEPRAEDRVLDIQVKIIKERLHEQVKPPYSLYR